MRIRIKKFKMGSKLLPKKEEGKKENLIPITFVIQ